MHSRSSLLVAWRRALPSLAGSLAVAIAAIAAIAPAAPATATTLQIESERLVWWPGDNDPPGVGAQLGLTLSMKKTGGPLVVAAGNTEAGSWVHPGATWGFSSGVALGDPHEPAGGAGSDVGLGAVEEAGVTSIVGVPGGFVYLTGIGGGAVTAVVKRGSGLGASNVIAVGQSTYNSNRGRVRIYEYAGSSVWQLVKTFIGTPGERLGKSLAITNSAILAGAPKYGANGAVRLYVRGSSGWIDWQLITSPATSQTDARFGAAVAINNNWIVVGSPNLDRTISPGYRTDRGGIYFYQPGFLQWVLFGLRVPAEAAQSYDNFGASVDLYGGSAVAGAPGDDVTFTDDGAAYYYQWTGSDWVAQLRLVDGSGQAGDALGTAVALGPLGVVAGSPNADANGVVDQGAVLFYDVP